MSKSQTKGISLAGLKLGLATKEATKEEVITPALTGEDTPLPEVLADVIEPTKDIEETQLQEKSFHVFYCTISSCKMLTDTARVIAFVDGKYITDQQEEIDYLKKEIALGSIYLSVVPGQEVMTATELDPMAMLRKKHFEEFKAEQAALATKISTGQGLTESESEVQPLTPGSTKDTSVTAAGSGQ